MDVRLIAETLSPRPGSTVLLGLQMTPQLGWHGYWSSAGESGLPPKVQWSAPRGVTFGPLQHPAPTLLRVMGMTSFVHAAPHVLISRMSIPRHVPVGTPLALTAHVSFGVCSDRLCVPQSADLAVRMVVGQGTPSAYAALLKRALADEPKAIRGGVFATNQKRLTLQLPMQTRLDASNTHFFPDKNGFFDPAEAHTLAGPPVEIVARLHGVAPRRITGVVSDGSHAFRLTFRRAH